MDVSQAQLFIDDEIIEHQTLLERILHQPARPRGNPVLCPEKPWEGESIAFCAGVYRVSETGGGHRLELPSTTTLTWRDIPVVQGENRIEVALDRLEGQDCLRIEGIELVIAYI